MNSNESGLSANPVRPVFGLTGGIACGKSTVARCFRELGAFIINADLLGHEAIEPGQPAHDEIIKTFGREILDTNGGIDRKKLGPKVFADPQQLRLLDSIVHPRIIARVKELAAAQLTRNPGTVVIVDAALIYEWNYSEQLSKVVVAWCQPDQQLDRLMAKTGIYRGEAERRIRSQMPVEDKRRRADYQIDCSGTIEESVAQAKAIYPELQRLAASVQNFQ